MIGGKFLCSKWLAASLRVAWTSKRLMTVVHRAAMSVLCSSLKLPVEARLTEVVMTRQRLGILRNVPAHNALQE